MEIRTNIYTPFSITIWERWVYLLFLPIVSRLFSLYDSLRRTVIFTDMNTFIYTIHHHTYDVYHSHYTSRWHRSQEPYLTYCQRFSPKRDGADGVLATLMRWRSEVQVLLPLLTVFCSSVGYCLYRYVCMYVCRLEVCIPIIILTNRYFCSQPWIIGTLYRISVSLLQ